MLEVVTSFHKARVKPNKNKLMIKKFTRNNQLTDNGENHYDEVKHIPAEFKVVQAHGNQTNDSLYNKDASEDIVQIP